MGHAGGVAWDDAEILRTEFVSSLQGVNIMAFCKEYNAKTADKAGQIIPVAITVYDVRGPHGTDAHILIALGGGCEAHRDILAFPATHIYPSPRRTRASASS